MRTILAVVVVMALMGCGTAGPGRYDSYLEDCVAMGFTPDTDNQRLCALQLETQRQVRAFGN